MCKDTSVKATANGEVTYDLGNGMKVIVSNATCKDKSSRALVWDFAVSNVAIFPQKTPMLDYKIGNEDKRTFAIYFDNPPAPDSYIYFSVFNVTDNEDVYPTGFTAPILGSGTAYSLAGMPTYCAFRIYMSAQNSGVSGKGTIEAV